MDELNYAVKPSVDDYYNILDKLHAFGTTVDPLYDLVFAADEDIPTLMHKFAAGVTQEMNRLKQAKDEKNESLPQ